MGSLAVYTTLIDIMFFMPFDQDMPNAKYFSKTQQVLLPYVYAEQRARERMTWKRHLAWMCYAWASAAECVFVTLRAY